MRFDFLNLNSLFSHLLYSATLRPLFFLLQEYA